VTTARPPRFSSTLRALIEPESWAILARGWRVTWPERRPRIRAIPLGSSNRYEPRVARDRSPPDAEIGSPAAEAARPHERREGRFVDVDWRACAAARYGTRPHTRAVSSPLPLPGGTTAGTPCIASPLVAPSREGASPRNAPPASRTPPELGTQGRQLAPWCSVTSAELVLRQVGADS
jgi:hypothetical protein